MLGQERTDEEVATLRAAVMREYADLDLEIDAFTCDECPAKNTCEWVFDLYNTDDDCLAEK